MKKKIKILYFIPGFYFGGIESLVLKICQLIDKEKFQIDILKHSNNPDNTEILSNLRSLGCHIYNLPKFSLKNIFSYIRETRKIIAISDYDVLHSHSLTYSLFLFFFARHKIPYRILHSHTSRTDGGFLKKAYFNLVKKGVTNFATDNFSCSNLASIWAFGKKENITIIKNGIETDLFSYDSKFREEKRSEMKLTNSFVVGHIGRVTKPKNLIFALEVFKKVLEIKSDSVFVQIGDGPDLPKIKEYAKNLGVDQNVLFLGKRDDVSKYYSMFDVFLFPSLWEGFPLSVIEAQTSGLSCVLSSEITKEVKILDNCQFIHLDAGVDIWANAIVLSKNDNRKEAISDVRKAGYDIRTTVKSLESIYKNKFENENIAYH